MLTSLDSAMAHYLKRMNCVLFQNLNHSTSWLCIQVEHFGIYSRAYVVDNIFHIFIHVKSTQYQWLKFFSPFILFCMAYPLLLFSLSEQHKKKIIHIFHIYYLLFFSRFSLFLSLSLYLYLLISLDEANWGANSFYCSTVSIMSAEKTEKSAWNNANSATIKSSMCFNFLWAYCAQKFVMKQWKSHCVKCVELKLNFWHRFDVLKRSKCRQTLVNGTK